MLLSFVEFIQNLATVRTDRPVQLKIEVVVQQQRVSGGGVGAVLALVFSPVTAQVTQALSSYLMFIYMASNERDVFQDFECEFALSMNIL